MLHVQQKQYSCTRNINQVPFIFPTFFLDSSITQQLLPTSLATATSDRFIRLIVIQVTIPNTLAITNDYTQNSYLHHRCHAGLDLFNDSRHEFGIYIAWHS